LLQSGGGSLLERRHGMGAKKRAFEGDMPQPDPICRPRGLPAQQITN
jgi:hypothetical protein